MQYTLRPYQQAASDAAVRFLMSPRTTDNGLIVLPTGAGKSLVIADIVDRLDGDVLILQPSKEILEQNYSKLCSYGYMLCSIYSASCGEKVISRATFATIGSIYKRVDEFRHFRYVIIDEAHTVEPAGGMYADFLKAIGAQCIGLTATPYRLYQVGDGQGGSGCILRFLTRQRPRFFSTLLHVTQISELVGSGYLAKLDYYNVPTIDMSNLKVNSTGQGYTDSSLRAEYARSNFGNKLSAVVWRLLHNAAIPRKGILVFTQFIDEAEELVAGFPGISAVVTGETPKRERAKILEDFKAGRLKVVANVGTLTTGFDYPELDTVVVARATRSLSLWYQIVGRALRPHPDKTSAWIVDLCDTYQRFGRVDELEIVDPTGRGLWQVQRRGKALTNVFIPAT